MWVLKLQVVSSDSLRFQSDPSLVQLSAHLGLNNKEIKFLISRKHEKQRYRGENHITNSNDVTR